MGILGGRPRQDCCICGCCGDFGCLKSLWAMRSAEVLIFLKEWRSPPPLLSLILFRILLRISGLELMYLAVKPIVPAPKVPPTAPPINAPFNAPLPRLPFSEVKAPAAPPTNAPGGAVSNAPPAAIIPVLIRGTAALERAMRSAASLLASKLAAPEGGTPFACSSCCGETGIHRGQHPQPHLQLHHVAPLY